MRWGRLNDLVDGRIAVDVFGGGVLFGVGSIIWGDIRVHEDQVESPHGGLSMLNEALLQIWVQLEDITTSRALFYRDIVHRLSRSSSKRGLAPDAWCLENHRLAVSLSSQLLAFRSTGSQRRSNISACIKSLVQCYGSLLNSLQKALLL